MAESAGSGDEGNRTPDLLNAIQTLSQLSYVPAGNQVFTEFFEVNTNTGVVRMSESIEDLQKKLKIQNDIIKGYEKVLRLNEQELENADEIIRMYEGIIQYSGRELKDAKEAFDATNVVTNLSREELMGALTRIRELENANKKLREESLKFQAG